MNYNMLDNVNGFQIKQQRQYLESFTGFEEANSYAITDAGGQPIFAAKEEGSGFLSRFFLKNNRPFTINLYTPNGQKVLEFGRKFAFIRHRLDVVDSESGSAIGAVKWKFSVVRKKFEIIDETEAHKYLLQTSPLSPWTFTIKNQYEQKIGTMAKKWTGLGLEMFTTSDNFGIKLDVDIPNKDKALLMGAVILADFIHFEDKD
ncbi:MAG: hypothetical protein Kapaf2KO_19950 [Candidatus Kapaibacteriales bacterium]